MKSKSTPRHPRSAAALGYAYSVRAEMIDGSTLDLLLFGDQQAANDHVAYIRNNCRLLGYDSLTVVKRLIIGKPSVIATT
jgi:hypothetical protein